MTDLKKGSLVVCVGAFVESSPSGCCSVTAPLSSSFKSSFQLIGSLSCARLCKFITPQQYSAATGEKVFTTFIVLQHLPYRGLV